MFTDPISHLMGIRMGVHIDVLLQMKIQRRPRFLPNKRDSASLGWGTPIQPPT